MSGSRPSTSKASVGFTLVVCEKPDAARRVAEALSHGPPETLKVGGVTAFRLTSGDGMRYLVCAAVGHLYGISETVKDRRVYPALDLEWFPLGETGSKAGRFVSSRIRAIQRLSNGADVFVNACDFDIEGETIGYNILKYACGGKEVSALRAKYSALTREEILEAFGDCEAPVEGLAIAGRLRHAIDFVWGVNLSRALSESLRAAYGFRTMSIGRVQGPALNFVVEREEELRTFVPTPYWTVAGTFRRGDFVFEAGYSSQGVLTSKRAAEHVKEACEGRDGTVHAADTRTFNEAPPPPLNLADLQKEVFRQFGYPPSRTLRVAEKLYLAALISYPRTGSQKLPEMDYGKVLSRIAAIPEYSDLARDAISEGAVRPVEGGRRDPAHPAIHPTGESPRRPLAEEEKRVFDIVVRRFLCCFGKAAVHEETSVEISVGGHAFRVDERRLLVPGWKKFDGGSRTAEAGLLASMLGQGDSVDVEAVTVKGHLRAPPGRYNQETLLEKMEKEGIGTKATRADIISTLLDRGYVEGQSLSPTQLGFSLVETMRDYCPQIISTRLTRDIESQLERVEATGEVGDGLEEALSTLLAQMAEIRSHGVGIGETLRGSARAESLSGRVLGRCPVCKEGELMIIRSSKTGKRFVGCTNYRNGCRASAPLPQRGALKRASKPCSSCGWPVVFVGMKRRSWRLCVNDRCPRKVNVFKMQNLQRSGGTADEMTSGRFEKS